MAVEFGVLIPTREAVMSGRPETAPLLAMAERAEAAGFDSVWIGDAGASHISLRSAGGDQLAQVDAAASRLLPRLKRSC
ncbi:MAG: LLM class flavin-dependent oxidoreductase [Candidatus Rokuibacteriota bacterium]